MDQPSQSLAVFRPIGEAVRARLSQLETTWISRVPISKPVGKSSGGYRRKRPMLSLSEDTYARFRAAAKAHGLPLAAFIAEATNGYIEHRSFPSKPVEAALREIFVELSRIGHNLNQWTRHLHASQKIGKAEIEQGKALLRELRAFLNTVREHPERFFKRPPQ